MTSIGSGKTYPKIDPYLVAFAQTHETIRKLKIDWLNEEETISLVARRHPIRMWIETLGDRFLRFLHPDNIHRVHHLS